MPENEGRAECLPCAVLPAPDLYGGQMSALIASFLPTEALVAAWRRMRETERKKEDGTSAARGSRIVPSIRKGSVKGVPGRADQIF